MSTVRMTKHISGTRNGEPWPAIGETIEVPDHEADQLVHAKLAEIADGESKAGNRKAASK